MLCLEARGLSFECIKTFSHSISQTCSQRICWLLAFCSVHYEQWDERWHCYLGSALRIILEVAELYAQNLALLDAQSKAFPDSILQVPSFCQESFRPQGELPLAYLVPLFLWPLGLRLRDEAPQMNLA